LQTISLYRIIPAIMEITKYNLQQMSPYAEIASKKISYIHDPELLSHNTSARRLPDILREGIIARKFAERIRKKDYVSQFGNQVSEEHISVTMAQEAIFGVDEILIFIKTTRPAIPIHHEGYKGELWKELLIKHRVSPREFVGIGLRKDSAYEFLARDILYLCGITWANNPENSVPVFECDLGNQVFHILPGLSQAPGLRILWPPYDTLV